MKDLLARHGEEGGIAMASTKTRDRRIKRKGTFTYRDFQGNHVIWPVAAYTTVAAFLVSNLPL
jgi:hypothetical protein